jgi:two-component system, LuxR family, response regulator FixJ
MMSDPWVSIPGNETVYIVDDDAAILDSLAMMLGLAGFLVASYADPETFLDEFDPNWRGCLVLDIHMPSMSGLGLQQDLLAIGSCLPIIFMSGRADVPTAVQALKAGAFDFLQKPFDKDRFVQLIQRAITANRLQHQQVRQQRVLKERLESLTPRETEVLDGMLNGKATKVIAIELSLSQRTVEIYRANVMQKMQTKSLAQLVRMISEVDGSLGAIGT